MDISISGFATMTIGSYPRTRELELDDYFKTLPVTMFTAFRCRCFKQPLELETVGGTPKWMVYNGQSHENG